MKEPVAGKRVVDQADTSLVFVSCLSANEFWAYRQWVGLMEYDWDGGLERSCNICWSEFGGRQVTVVSDFVGHIKFRIDK